MEIKGVEILKAGVWNQTRFTLEHLKQIVEAFDKQDWETPVKLGHDNKPEAPAYGWVRNLRIAGDTLLADFVDVPKEVYGMIKQRMFNNVSVEIFFNIERAGKKFARALKAVALLGAHLPAVSGLKPVSESLSQIGADEADAVVSFMTGDSLAQFADDDSLEGNSMNQLVLMLSAVIAGIVGTDEKARSALLTKLAKDSGMKEDRFTKILDGEVKELSDDDVTKIGAALASANGKVTTSKDGTGDDTDALRQQITALQAKLDQSDADKEVIASLQSDLKELQEESNRNAIEAKIKGVKIPSLRHYFRSLYEFALANKGEKVRLFSAEKKDFQEMEPVAVVDSMVEFINEKAGKLFTEHSDQSSDRQLPGAEDAGAEVDKKTREYMAANKTDDYQAAMTAVLQSDQELAQRYANEGVN